jgi:hypothetical protein
MTKRYKTELARLDRIYTPTQNKLNMYQTTYFIHDYSVGSDHVPIHLELHIDCRVCRKAVFKWNIFYLKEEVKEKMEEKWKKCRKKLHFSTNLGTLVDSIDKQASKKKGE